MESICNRVASAWGRWMDRVRAQYNRLQSEWHRDMEANVDNQEALACKSSTRLKGKRVGTKVPGPRLVASRDMVCDVLHDRHMLAVILGVSCPQGCGGAFWPSSGPDLMRWKAMGLVRLSNQSDRILEGMMGCIAKWSWGTNPKPKRAFWPGFGCDFGCNWEALGPGRCVRPILGRVWVP